MKPLRTLISTGVLFLSLSVAAMADSDHAGTVTATDLNLRSEPTTASESVELVQGGASVLVTGIADEDWYSVYVNGQTGYMSANFLRVKKTASDMTLSGSVINGITCISADPSLSADLLGIYYKETAITVTGITGGWYTVDYGDETGYIRCDHILLDGMDAPLVFDETEDETQTNEGEAIVASAMDYLGVRYVYGGSSPSGFDCSGLVYYICTNLGYNVSRTAAAQVGNGISVTDADLEPGDLVFFANGGGGSVGHVGIYIGDGQFVHACSGTGRVMISNLSESYYASYYCGATRLAY